jgi:hypothetical protein
MVERLSDMPAGAIGFRASGKLTKADYTRSAWKRFALATDIDWIAKATRVFTWMIPGEVRIFDLDGVEDATVWINS